MEEKIILKEDYFSITKCDFIKEPKHKNKFNDCVFKDCVFINNKKYRFGKK